MVFDKKGVRIENYIDDGYFNREAVVEYTYRDCMLEHGAIDPKDEDEYSIRFLDDNNSLAWVRADELVSKVSNNQYFDFIGGKEKDGNK